MFYILKNKKNGQYLHFENQKYIWNKHELNALKINEKEVGSVKNILSNKPLLSDLIFVKMEKYILKNTRTNHYLQFLKKFPVWNQDENDSHIFLIPSDVPLDKAKRDLFFIFNLSLKDYNVITFIKKH